MKSEHFRIFFTGRKPVTPNGKRNTSVWKNADSFYDFFSLQEVETSSVKIKFSMMYDKQNLYIYSKYSMPDALRNKETSTVTEKPQFQYLFILGKKQDNRILRIILREEGSCEVTVNGDPKEPADLKFSMSTQELRSGYKWESVLTIPFEILERKAPADGEILSFSAIHSCRNPDWECLRDWNILTPLKTIYTNNDYWINGSFSEKAEIPASYSAAERLRDSYANAEITLDPEECASGPYKNILGMNNSPRISSALRVEKEKALFKKLGPARVRHHDAVLCDPGYALIDVSRIFPLFRADHNDPENYDFAPTDLYLGHVKDCGIPIEFRFGESIEHSGTTFRVNPPTDPQKWAEICVNILRHYLQGWHNGMKLDITHASLWEEPDGIYNLFTGPYEKYLELYKCFATEVKKAFPDVKVGGPEAIALEKIDEFCAFCRKNDLPLDFLGKTAYNRRLPRDFSDQSVSMRDIARKHGYHNVEIFMSEWHMCPRSWKKNFFDDRETIENAAFSAASIMLMQDVTDMAYFYIWASAGFYGLFSDPDSPFKVYYALCLYTEFIRKNGNVLPVKMECEQPGNYYMASVDEKGTVHLLFARYISMTEQLKIQLPSGYRSCRMKTLSDESPAAEKIKEFKSDRKGSFVIPFPEKAYGVYLLEFAKS